jgi:hypothetical protein
MKAGVRTAPCSSSSKPVRGPVAGPVTVKRIPDIALVLTR